MLIFSFKFSLDRFLLPSTENKTKPTTSFKSFGSYAKNNLTFVIFIVAYAIVNLGLFISRAIQYKDSNIFYILARACGMFIFFLFFVNFSYFQTLIHVGIFLCT
jgi:hypothetical protein